MINVTLFRKNGFQILEFFRPLYETIKNRFLLLIITKETSFLIDWKILSPEKS